MRTAGLFLFLLFAAPPAFAQVAAVVPAQPTTASFVQIRVTHLAGRQVTITRTGNVIRVDITLMGLVIDPLPIVTELYDVGPLPAGTYTVEVRDEGTLVQTFSFAVGTAVAPVLSWPAIALLAASLIGIGWIAIGREM